MNAPNNYLVPYDFEEKSENALQNALKLAHADKGEVYLLHIVSHHTERFKKITQLHEVKIALPEKDQEIVHLRVITGDLIKDITKASELLNAKMVVISYKNETKFKSLFTKTEVKIISESYVPHLVTTSGVVVNDIKKIVFPFNYHTESIQIARFLSKFAKKRGAKVYMVGNKNSDADLATKTHVNSKVLEKVFLDAGVEFGMKTLEENSDIEQAIINYAKEVGADVISATDYEKGFFINQHTFLTKLLENEYNIPVIAINADEYSHATEQFSFIGT